MPEPEVVIVGAGPAGSTLASLLALKGRRPLVIERERFPFFKIGESLLPQSCRIFQKTGVMERLEGRFIKKYGARFVDDQTGDTVRYRFADALDKRFPHAFQVEREKFDMVLLERAVELGAEVLQPCKVSDVLFEGERAVGVRIADGRSEREIRAPMIVDATGRGAMLASRLRGKSRLAGLDTAAMFTHYEGLPRATGEEEGDIVVLLFEHGWYWYIPFRGDVTSVGAVVKSSYMAERRKDESLEDFFARTTAPVKWMAERLAVGRAMMPMRTAADFSYGVEQYAGDGWLCVGDANGFIDPLFSTGVHLGLVGADVAADAIDAALAKGDTSKASFESYERAVRFASTTFLGLVQGNYNGTLTEYLFERNQRKIIRQLITSILSGDVWHDEQTPQWVKFMREHMPALFG
jgi:flavin-dependent dehydrogenase